MMKQNENEVAVFGGGCFWCMEAVFKMLKGVVAVTSGYAGGSAANPSYEQVHSGQTGHIEVVRVEFNAAKISFKKLLEVFFSAHDPTTLNRQGNDVGEQYSSVVFCSTDDQKKKTLEYIRELEKSGVYDKPIVTSVRSLEIFYKAEDDHKNYYANNPDQAYCQVVIVPKLDKVGKKYKNLLK